MTVQKRSLFKRILIDIAGVGLIILAVAIGWLPGPGFIPLFLAGLALLASNHKWAKRWLKSAKEKGTSAYDLLFPDNPWIKALYDVLSILLLIIGIVFIKNHASHIYFTLAIIFIVFALGLSLSNRKRLENLLKSAKKTS